MSDENFQTNAQDVVDSVSQDQEISNQEELENVDQVSASESDSGDIQDVLSDVLDGDSENNEQMADSEEGIEEKIQELKKKLKLKVDGEEFEEELDFNDEDRLKRALQKEKAFDKRSQEWASYQKQVNQFMEALKSNPGDVLRQMGHDLDELAYNHLQQAVEEAKKSPEQLAQEKMQKELEDLKAEKERLSKEKEEAELERLKNEEAAKIENDIKSALDDTETILPKKNPWVLRKVAETMILAIQNGYPEVTASQVIPLVEQQFMNDLQSMFDVFPEEVIEKVVKKQNLDRYRKKRLGRKKQVNTKTAKQIAQPTNNKVPADGKEPVKKKTYKDLFDPRF